MIKAYFTSYLRGTRTIEEAEHEDGREGIHLLCSLLREYEGQGLAPLHRDRDEKRLNMRWSLFEEGTLILLIYFV